jgi:hypothetical protein
MKLPLRTIVLALSLVVNAAFLLILAFSLSRRAVSVSFLDKDSAETRYDTGVCIASVPRGGVVVFGSVELVIKTGEEASLQFSSVMEKIQSNIALEVLYDRALLRVERSPYGLDIKALAPGKTLLQTVTRDGIRDVARVIVEE